MPKTRPDRTPARPAPRRRGWIPLGLTGRILLTTLVVPAASVAPRAGGEAAEELALLGRAVLEHAARGYDIVAHWAADTLDASTRAGDAARDRRWASGR